MLALVALSCDSGAPRAASDSVKVGREIEHDSRTGVPAGGEPAADSTAEQGSELTAASVPPSQAHGETTARDAAPEAGARTDDPRAGPWRPGGAWRAELLWRAGTVLGDERLAFGRITNVSMGPDGRTYAIDFVNQHIVVLGSDGAFERHIGRHGRGPGEFDGPLGMAWDHRGRLWIADGWNRRYTVFDTTGAVVKTVPRDIISMVSWTQLLRVDSAAFIIDQTARTVDGRYAVQFLRVDTAGSNIDSFPPLMEHRSVSASLTPMQLVRARDALEEARDFRPRWLYALAPDGTLWIMQSNQLRLVNVTLEGDTLRVIDSNHRQPRSASAELRRVRDELKAAGLDADADEVGPQIAQSVNVLADGHIVVQIESSAGEPGRLFDVFEPAGRYLGQLDLGFAAQSEIPWFSRGDTLVVVEKGEADVNFIVKLVLRRG